MFVRLFVDENLDRIVPISKQPKEKIQAIIDSCTRQFPEFAERARKRIRTYLKSCRRNKKVRGDGPATGNGNSAPGTGSAWDSAVRVRSPLYSCYPSTRLKILYLGVDLSVLIRIKED